MHCRYYTRFIVEHPACEDYRACAGVVELDAPAPRGAAEPDIVRMLAERLGVDENELTLLHWSALR